MKWQGILAVVLRVVLAAAAAYLGTTVSGDPAAGATLGAVLGVAGKP